MVRQIAAHFQEAPRTVLEERVRRLETTVDVLSEALRVLARGLEGGPLAGPGEQQVADAGRRASELLLSTEVSGPGETRGGETGGGKTGAGETAAGETGAGEPAPGARPGRIGEPAR